MFTLRVRTEKLGNKIFEVHLPSKQHKNKQSQITEKMRVENDQLHA
jgi:hypothetical protein